MRKVIVVIATAVFIISCYSIKTDASIKGVSSGEKYEKIRIYEPYRDYKPLEETITNYSICREKTINKEEAKVINNSIKEKESYEYLVPKTKDNYEVTLSYEDGSYAFVDSCDTYESAVTIADLEKSKSEVTMAKQVVVPTVINAKGEVVYATEEVGRVWKNYLDDVNNEDDGRTMVSYIYLSDSMGYPYTYISDSYISEVPIIKKNKNEAQVLVAGYKGWMNTNREKTTGRYNHPNQDLRIAPVTAVTNPSHYTVESGILYHHISTSMDGNAKNNAVLAIGYAPSYLKSGHTYYSYDGNYFYEGSRGTAEALRTLMRDLQSDSYSRAVNANNPYYNYYNYLPFRTQTSYTAGELNRFIAYKTKNSGALLGSGQAFIDAQNKYGVNALIALGIAGNESAWGSSDYAVNRNNLFGINATDDDTDKNAYYFSSVRECIDSFAKNLISNGYANPADWRDYGGFLGNKQFGANVYYASDPYWSEKAAKYAFEIDRYLSGGKEYDKYQLLLSISPSSVVDSSRGGLYNILSSVSQRGSHVGTVSAFSKNSILTLTGQACYAINPEITSSLKEDKFDGNYNWGVKGYIPINTVKMINKGKNYFDDEDIDMDAKVSTIDLTNVAKSYNKTSSNYGWNGRCDVNHDGIVDIYDIVKVSSKL